ncbi:amidase signature enzyme [Vararia minispora EC-137]|uniref:Amidase signature enzyme n=1 Tax=Vararia minispora EC-137 TaxID=1314806 RepID=A0ACB8QUD9_9AGAM|nr:amidase signature enzyme [Vararia minispora EC-137]
MNIGDKDNICTKDMPTTCSSAMLADYWSPFDATVVDLLRQSGAGIIGKANCDEFGMGSLNVHSIYGPVVNPAFPTDDIRSAGGSSGGSAAAVAAGLCNAALGTDTGGSVRLPASYCGVVGLKPSYGMLSRWGVVSFADSLDCVGVLAKDVDIAHRVFNTLSKYDGQDSTSASPETREKAQRACEEHMQSWRSRRDLAGLRIGVPQEYFPASLSPASVDGVREMLRALRERGATLVPVSLPNTPYALSAYYVLASAEASSNLARYDGVQYGSYIAITAMCLHVRPTPHQIGTPASTYALSRTQGFGREVKKRILLGTYALSADAFDNYFLQAQRLRNLIRQDFRDVFLVPDPLLLSHSPASVDGVHALVHPSAVQTAPPLPDTNVISEGDSLGAYVQDILTVPASLAGLPAVSVPARGKNKQGPVGVSIVGQWGCEAMILEIARVIEGSVA